MKVLTIKQPWATLIMQQDKKFEFRSWQTKYRGELLIHAGKQIDKEAVKRLSKYLPKELPTGKILGKATLIDCIRCNNEFIQKCQQENKDIYAKNRYSTDYAWQLENIEQFQIPIEAKGKLSLWEYDIESKTN